MTLTTMTMTKTDKDGSDKDSWKRTEESHAR
jgi:hypothetical protein